MLAEQKSLDFSLSNVDDDVSLVWRQLFIHRVRHLCTIEEESEPSPSMYHSGSNLSEEALKLLSQFSHRHVHSNEQRRRSCNGHPPSTYMQRYMALHPEELQGCNLNRALPPRMERSTETDKLYGCHASLVRSTGGARRKYSQVYEHLFRTSKRFTVATGKPSGAVSWIPNMHSCRTLVWLDEVLLRLHVNVLAQWDHNRVPTSIETPIMTFPKSTLSNSSYSTKEKPTTRLQAFLSRFRRITHVNM